MSHVGHLRRAPSIKNEYSHGTPSNMNESDNEMGSQISADDFLNK